MNDILIYPMNASPNIYPISFPILSLAYILNHGQTLYNGLFYKYKYNFFTKSYSKISSESLLYLFPNFRSHSDLFYNYFSKLFSKYWSQIFLDIQFSIFSDSWSIIFPYFLHNLFSNSHSNIIFNMKHICILNSASFIVTLQKLQNKLQLGYISPSSSMYKSV